MAMNYTTLVAAKTVNGSIAAWVNYSKLDAATILDEAQLLLWNLGLRTREMKTSFIFPMVKAQSYVALPTGFLDPTGPLYSRGVTGLQYEHRTDHQVRQQRAFNSTGGTLALNPFATVNLSPIVTVSHTNHGLGQSSSVTYSGATAVAGLTLNGSFVVASVINDNSYTITAASNANATTTGGGAVVGYTYYGLILSSPMVWAIWDERIQFDTAFDVPDVLELPYYAQPALLAASTNETNFLTTRYPRLLRQACICMAADFMKDDAEYQKGIGALTGLLAGVEAETEFEMRGSIILMDNP